MKKFPTAVREEENSSSWKCAAAVKAAAQSLYTQHMKMCKS